MGKEKPPITPLVGNYDIKPLDLKDAKVDSGQKPKQYKEKKMSKVRSVLGALKRTISGENKTGEAIHGVLDILPIPNQIIAKGVRAIFDGDKDVAKQEFSKLLTVRNGAALIASILVLTGVLTVDDVKKLLEILSEFL